MEISIGGEWHIANADGDLADRSLDNAQRDAYRAHRLLGRSITGHDVNAPESFALRFDNGWSLVVFDRSPEYESFSIQPGDIFV